MALLTDGTISRIEDLSAYDSQLLTVANTEGINVTQKLTLAQEEISLEVSGMLARMSGWGGSDGTWLPGASSARTTRHVVVTRPLKLWHTLRSLELVYRDAYHNQLNERYSGKRDEYAKMAAWAHEKLVEGGLGIVWKPIPEAVPVKLQAASGGLADGTYYVGMAWTNAAGEEGACSRPSQIQVSGSSFTVQAGAAPEKAAGWNVYAGSDPAGLTLQSATPLTLGTSFHFPDVLATNGRAAGNGQEPNYIQPVPRLIQRG